MTDIFSAFAWLANPANWSGPTGIWVRVGEHLEYSIVTVILAAIIAIPIGLAIGHTGRFRGLAISVSGAFRALPTLGLLIFLALLLSSSVGLVPPGGLLGPLIALTVLAIPPVLAGAYSGVESVDPKTVDAARALGMTEFQILLKVELPLGLPLIIGGLRSATLQVIATWTVAAFLPLGGLGRFLFDGLADHRYDEMLGGSILVIVLALLADGLFAIIQRLVVPRGVVVGRVSDVRVRAARPHATASKATPDFAAK
jgi:osmoprotectant transport system permease protein